MIFEIFKKICNEIDSGFSEQELYEILKSATNNGNELTFKEFQDFMLVKSK